MIDNTVTFRFEGLRVFVVGGKYDGREIAKVPTRMLANWRDALADLSDAAMAIDGELIMREVRG